MAKAKFRLPDSGQVACYNRNAEETGRPGPGDEHYGQNGCFIINPLSYSKLDKKGKSIPDSSAWADGLRTVRDENTGLVWEVKSPKKGDVNFCDDQYGWQDAQKKYIARLNKARYGGFSDWRMPNKDELRTILDYGRTNPSIDTRFFPHCKVGSYWCANTYMMQPYFGWVLFFGFGSATAASKKSGQYVRAVRGGHNPKYGTPDLGRFTDNGDGTVTDDFTGLMWQKGENDRMNWFDALERCRKMDLSGHRDWRLPNIKELNTILNLEYNDGWWYYRTCFPAEGLAPPLLHYFSSTSHEKYFAWVTNFCFGYDGYYANKNAMLLFRAVRNVTSPPPSAGVFVLPDTGQHRCFDDEGNIIAVSKKGGRFAGQDGSYRLSPMSFTKLGEGERPMKDDALWEDGLRMIKDNNTGLIWEIKSPDAGDVNFMGDAYTWEDAKNAYFARLNNSAYGGFSDWRLPNKEELRTIVDYGGPSPAVDGRFFENLLADFYWSTDTYGADTRLSWGIYFGYGCGICYLKTSPYRVLAVRGGYNRNFGDPANYSFRDNGDGTVSDLNSGLMWKKEESPELNLEEALKYCGELNLAGHDDWRLPTMKELPTLLDLSFGDSQWFLKEFFPDVKTKPLGFYWASSTFGSTFGWGVNFQFGYDGYYAGKKEGRYPFRPVRNIDNKKPE